MKVFGLVCGRKSGNSEILVKTALMGAEEEGAEVEIIRLGDLRIEPCRGCENCTARMARGDPAECAIKDDDIPFIQEKFRQLDGLIIGAPVYFLTPPGYLKVLTDRMLPWQVNATRRASQHGEKKRPAGFVSVGGGTATWTSMGLSLMKLLTFNEFATVDQLQVTEAARPAQVLLDDAVLEKARNLGRRVAQAASQTDGDLSFMGEEPGLCPVCHSNLVVHLKKGEEVECPICGAVGTLTVGDDGPAMILDEAKLAASRCTLTGRLLRYGEIKKLHERYNAKIKEIKRKEEQYKSYLSYTLPPSKKGHA